MAQIIYPKYAGFIVVYVVIFLILGTTVLARLLDKHFPYFPEKEEREKNIEQCMRLKLLDKYH